MSQPHDDSIALGRTLAAIGLNVAGLLVPGKRELALANALFAALDQLLPELDSLLARGEITKEEQAALLQRYQSLKARAEGQFTGPEWLLES